MWLNTEERITLTGLGVVALAGLGLLLWQRQRPSLVIAGEPTRVQAIQWDRALAVARQIDMNTASVAELERLPEVGPALAKRIVEYRTTQGPFHDLKELARVKGIGPKKYKALEAYLTVK